MTSHSPDGSGPLAPAVLHTALVSGASSGIGRATALMLASHGWRVYAGVRQLAAAPPAADDAPGRIDPVELDVTSDESVVRAVERVKQLSAGQPLAALVNNAGIGRMAPMEHVSIPDLRAIWSVNVEGAVRLTQAFLPFMTEGSRVVFVSSVGDRLTPPFAGALSASKSALTSLAVAFRLELQVRGIGVSIVEPGAISTSAVAKVQAGARETADTISATDPAAADRFRRAAAIALRHERSGSSPDTVARSILLCLTARRPPSRVLVGRGARSLALLSALLPDRTVDAVLLRVFGLAPVPRGKDRRVQLIR